MAASESKKDTGALPPEQADALFGHIMEDLGGQPAADRDLAQAVDRGRGRYAQVAVRSMLPWLLLVVVMAVLAAMTVKGESILESSIHIENLAGEAVQEQAATVARVSFKLDAGYFKPDITAQLGEDLLPVQQDGDVYYIDCLHDGVLLITATSWNGTRDVKKVTIAGLGG